MAVQRDVRRFAFHPTAKAARCVRALRDPAAPDAADRGRHPGPWTFGPRVLHRKVGSAVAGAKRQAGVNYRAGAGTHLRSAPSSDAAYAQAIIVEASADEIVAASDRSGCDAAHVREALG